MIVLIPLSRFRIDYEVASGRPYSKLDVLVLRAIQERPASLDHLRETFGLPPRLLIEILVNLFHERWISVTEDGFAVTSRGRIALSKKERPASHAVWPEHADVWMERITGGLAPKRDIRYETRKGLQNLGLWDEAHRLRAEFLDNHLDQGQVRFLLPRAAGQWVRHVAPPMMTSKRYHWLPIDVDPDQGTIVGLPERWRNRLSAYLLAEILRLPSVESAGQFWSGDRAVRRIPSDQLSGWYSVKLLPEDMILEGNRDEFQRALSETESMVLISSTSLSRPTGKLTRTISDALARGVHIDLIWGGSQDEPRGDQDHAVRDLIELTSGMDGALQQAHGSLRVNSEPADLRANIIISDKKVLTNDHEYTVIMGAFAWLSSTALDHQISVRISHPAITEEICLSMAALLDRPDDKGLSVGSDRWHHLAGELSRQAAYRSNVNAEEDTSLEKQTENVDITDSLVRVVRDQDHLAVLTEYLQTAQDRLAISCTTMDEIALKRLHPLKYRKSPVANLKVFFSAPDPQSPKCGPILEMIRSMGGEAFYKPAMRLNALVMDTSVVFSSYRFLAGNVSGTARRGDIGLQIENSSFADTLWSFLNR